MRRGCITVYELQCDDCGRVMKHPEQYLVLDEDDILPKDDVLARLQAGRPERYVVVNAKRGSLCICVNCSLKKGYGHYRKDRGNRVLTFFDKTAGK